MRIYVIGPTSGIGDGNRKAFDDAAKELERAGYSALVPHWFIPKDAPWITAMRRSIETLVKCDGIAVLEGFGKSKGARVEADLATGLGLPVKSVETWVRMSVKGER